MKKYSCFTRAVLISLIVLSSHPMMAQCWKQVEAGGVSSVGIKTDGSLWTWGYGGQGCLGTGSYTASWQPQQVGFQHDWKQVSMKGVHVLALKNNGTLWAWGYNMNGELGDSGTQNCNKPKQIGMDNDWKMVSAGSSHSLALKSDGSLWGWGENFYGGLGNGSSAYTQLFPIQIGTDKDWAFISSGSKNFSHGIKTDGSLWAWGYGFNLQLGNGSLYDQLSPVRIGTDNDWLMVDNGNTHTMALKKDHSLWIWGSGGYGLLGTGRNADTFPVRLGPDTTWSLINAGGAYSLAIKSDGTLWGWGYNAFGQLGTGSDNPDKVMNPIQIGTKNNWSLVNSGPVHHTLAITEDGNLWGWGLNDNGMIGDATDTDRIQPVTITCPQTSSIDKAGISPGLLSVFPVPAEDVIDILNPSSLAIEGIRVVDMLGREYLYIHGEQSRIDVSALADGIYFVEIHSAGRIVICKIVKGEL